jgi:hypothetical protein
MGTITAQIMIGQNHPYEGGMVNLSHYLFLSENGVARWTLRESNLLDSSRKFKPISWIPTIEHMLEDGLLMITLFVLREEKLIQMAEQAFGKPLHEVTNFYSEIAKEDLIKLHMENQRLLKKMKLMVNVFQGSTIFRQVSSLHEYQELEIEVCKSIYTRQYSMWNGQYEASGFLE